MMTTNPYHSYFVQMSQEPSEPMTASISWNLPPNDPPTEQTYNDEFYDLANEIAGLSLKDWEVVKEILENEHGVYI